jgi:DNA polymerase-3 subunit alpha
MPANGLIALSGAHFGDIGMAIENGNRRWPSQCAKWAHFPGHFYIEIQRAGQPNQECRCATRWRWRPSWACRWWPPIRCSSCPGRIHRARSARLYRRRRDAGQRQARAQVQRADAFPDAGRDAELFADLPAALQNSVEIAKRCNLTLTLGKPQLPNFPTPGMTIDEFLVAETKKGLEERLSSCSRSGQARANRRATKRLEFENNTIIKMKFPGYFLIVAEFIQWARTTACRSARAGVRARVRWWRMR